MNKEILDELNKTETALQESNENPYTFEWMIRNNMMDCGSFLSPYDQKWLVFFYIFRLFLYNFQMFVYIFQMFVYIFQLFVNNFQLFVYIFLLFFCRFGRFVYKDRQYNKKWNLTRQSKYPGPEGVRGN